MVDIDDCFYIGRKQMYVLSVVNGVQGFLSSVDEVKLGGDWIQSTDVNWKPFLCTAVCMYI